jgi:hypothetical protein
VVAGEARDVIGRKGNAAIHSHQAIAGEALDVNYLTHQHWQISPIAIGMSRIEYLLPIAQRFSPATIGNREEQHTPPRRNIEKVNNRF